MQVTGTDYYTYIDEPEPYVCVMWFNGQEIGRAQEDQNLFEPWAEPMVDGLGGQPVLPHDLGRDPVTSNDPPSKFEVGDRVFMITGRQSMVVTGTFRQDGLAQVMLSTQDDKSGEIYGTCLPEACVQPEAERMFLNNEFERIAKYLKDPENVHEGTRSRLEDALMVLDWVANKCAQYPSDIPNDPFDVIVKGVPQHKNPFAKMSPP